MKSLLANWKTTAGGIGAGLGALADIFTQVSQGNFDANHLWLDIVAISTAWGLLTAKDGNVTGGTVKQPSK